MRTIGVVCMALVVMFVAASAQAATIAWGPVTAVNFADPAQILGTAGGYTYVEAVTAYKTGPLSVNGVTFLPLSTVGSSALYTGAAHITQTLTGARTDSGWVTPTQPDDYKRMLVSTSYLSTGGDGAINLSGLVSGTKYRVQLWTGWWDNDVYATKYDGFSLNPGDYNGPGGGNETPVPPQFMVGTFTADATSQTIAITAMPGGANPPYYDIRMYAGAVSLYAIPEPATMALLGLGGLGLLFNRKRR